MAVLYGVICQAQILGTGSLNSARRGHTATLMQDGKILIVGGDDASGLVSQAEIFDPLSLASSNLAANPAAPRTDHTATLLADGRVLIIGGVDQNGLMNSTEFYNPYSIPTPSFSAGASLMRARSGHTATILSDGKILIVGGEVTGSAEIYDPSTQTFSLVSGHLNTPRQYHSAALLNSGKVLIAGGVVGTNMTLTSAEIYDPQTQTFTPASGPMQTPRGLALLRVLPDGKVQVIGGDGEFSMEMFDPATASFIALAHIPPHEDYLNNIIASRTRSALITTIIQQNPVLQGQPELTPEIIALLNRLDHTITEVPQSNRALIAGGVNDAGQILNSATVVSSSAATVTTDKFDYAPGEVVAITGSGFQPNETVWMLFHEEPETHDDVVISSVADIQGRFTNMDFAPAQNDLNRNFTLTAIGQSSGFTAQTAFKDALTITSISPSSGPTTGGTPLTITGSGFTNGQDPFTVTFGGTSVAGTRIDNTHLSATTPAHVAGAVNVNVTDKGGAPGATLNNGFTYIKVTPTITWNSPADITYGTALNTTQLNATASVPGTFVYTPAAGTVLNAGNQILHVDFTPTDTGTYNNASKNVSINVLKATPTISWGNPADITYGTALSGTQLNATATAVVNGVTVSVAGVFTYTPPSGTILSAGNGQNLHVSFAPTDTTNYNSPVTKDVTINVLKKDATWTTNPNSKTYGDSDPSPLTTGSGGGFLASDNVTATYSRAAGETVAGNPYHITATLSPAGVLGNYTITNPGADFTISAKAASVTPNASSKTYGDADPTLTGTLVGFLAGDGVTATYSRTAGENVAGSPYIISATLSPASVLTNYSITYKTANFTINKANAICTINGYTGTYDNAAHGATGSCKGVDGTTVLAGLNLGASFTIVPGGTANWSFTDVTGNYNDQSGSVPIVINKANATISVNGYTGIYDGNPHGATGTATGVGGVDLSGSLNLGATFTNVPGGTVHWTFSGGTNYNDASGDVAIVINQATPTVSVTGGTFTDNAQPHGASGFAYGIGGVGDMLSPAVTFSYEGSGYGPTANAPSTPGTYLATANFAGNTNYTSAYATANITIENAAPRAQGQTIATNEDVPLPITLRARDLDSNGLTFTITNGPSNGSLDLTAGTLTCASVPIAPGAMSCTAAVTYTPNQNYNGADSFKFKVSDGQLDSNEATVTLTIYPVNDAPTANAQSVSTDDFTPLPITLTGSDAETAATNLTFAIVDQPMNGTLSGTPPNMTYTPNLNYKGPDFFTFTVTDRGDPDNCGAPSQTCADAKTTPRATVSITVTDGTPPQTLITNLKPASLSNDRNPTFGFSGTDNVTDVSALTFECNLDYGVKWTLCGTAGNPTTTYSDLADGSHTFQVRGMDDSGNVDPNPPSYTWTIDATPPDTLIDSQPPALANSATATFTFNSSENNSTLSCSLDGGAAVDCSSGTKTYTGLSDGQHNFTVAATDQAGNLDPTAASVTWMIDTTAPQTSIDSQPSNPTTSTSATFTFHGSDPTGQDSFECSLDGATFTPCTSPKTHNGLALGNHSFAVRAKDTAGNMDATPASYSWTIGQVTLDQYTIDSDFKHFDGFDVVFGRGSGSYLKINSTNPDSFHYQIKLTNNTSLPISAANGNVATAIITVPSMPPSCGGVPCSSQIGSLVDPAFVLKGRKVAHVWPGYHDRDGDDDDDDMPVTIQYKSSGSCDINTGYSSTLPANSAPKCIKITGFSIPVKHSARIRLNFQFRWKGTDGWNANAQQLFYAGFVFRATTSVNFGSNVQTASDATGIVGAGKKATAIGGYVFSGITPDTGKIVRLFTKKTDASCTVNSKLVAQDVIDANGFYYIWRSGTDQHNSNANSLPSGVQYAVQLCDGSTQLGLTTIDSKLRDQEFEQIDFNP